MITSMTDELVVDFSNVVLSRRRRPYYVRALKLWYLKDANGRSHKLHPDKSVAFRIWRKAMRRGPEPRVIPGQTVGTDRPLETQWHRSDKDWPRAQLKFVRLLKLVDLLASCRYPKQIGDINQMVSEAMGRAWSTRTIARDLQMLHQIGMLRVTSAGYKLELQRSERLQEAAIAVFPD